MSLRLSRTPARTALLAGLLALAACGGSGPGSTDPAATAPVGSAAAVAETSAAAAPAATTAAASPVAETCPEPVDEGDPWPAEVPADLPKPRSIAISESVVQDSGLRVVRFSNPVGLRDNVVFVVEALPAAGYVLGRGDAEAQEADAPFQKDDLRGILRMVASTTCSTDWLLAFALAEDGGSTAPVPSYAPSSSPSPLPFG